MKSIEQTVIDSLHNEVMTLRKLVVFQQQEAQIVQAGIDFLEVQELDEEIKLDIEIENAKIYSKELDTKISETFKKWSDERN